MHHCGILSPGSREAFGGPWDTSILQHRFGISLEYAANAGHMPLTWTRAAIAIRINCLLKGCSGVRRVVLERLQDLLRHNIIPIIPLRGSISASGDLTPLSYIGNAIQGKPTIRIFSEDGSDLYADQAFRRACLEPVPLQAKEGLAIMNGTATSAAAACLALHDAHGLAVLAQILTAMSTEALAGTIESFDPFFGQVRPHPGQVGYNPVVFFRDRLTRSATGRSCSKHSRFLERIGAYKRRARRRRPVISRPLLHPHGVAVDWPGARGSCAG